MPRRHINKSVAGVLLALLVLGAAALLQVLTRSAPAAVSATEDGVTVHFSPHGGCTEAVVEQLAAAQKTIDVQAYSFTSKEIAEALVAAHRRGVAVRVILDASQRTEQYSSATFLHHQHIPVFIDAKHAIAHSKIMIIDGRTIITGSFNFTHQAEVANAENLLILQDKFKLVAAYQQNFAHHLDHSEAYAG